MVGLGHADGKQVVGPLVAVKQIMQLDKQHTIQNASHSHSLVN